MTVTATAELESFDGASVIKAGTPTDDIGIGIAQGLHAEIGHAIWIVVLSAQRR